MQRQRGLDCALHDALKMAPASHLSGNPLLRRCLRLSTPKEAVVLEYNDHLSEVDVRRELIFLYLMLNVAVRTYC